MRTAIIIGAALLGGTAISSPAFAAEARPAAAGAQSPDIEVRAEPEKRICRREQAVGTRLAPRTCLTRSQWKARERENEEHKRRILDRANGAPTEHLLPGEPTGGGG